MLKGQEWGVLRKHISGRRKSICKGPVAERSAGYLRGRRASQVPGKGSVREEEVADVGSGQPRQCPPVHRAQGALSYWQWEAMDCLTQACSDV